MMKSFSRRDAALRALTAAAALLLLLLPVRAPAGDDWYPERRRDQFPTDPGHVAIPLPFNLEGIGWGVGVLGALTKVAGTCTDVSGAAFTADITGGSRATSGFTAGGAGCSPTGRGGSAGPTPGSSGPSCAGTSRTRGPRSTS